MVPGAIAALEAFVRNVRSFGLPFDTILTQGSLYCRCIRGSNPPALSNHSFGDAIDVAGVRWTAAGGPASRVRETIVHNFRDPEQRGLLRRLNACLRLSFATVIDYHRADHQDHFHCDTNQGGGRITRGAANLRFVQEALGAVLGRTLKITGKLDDATTKALLDYSRRGQEIFKEQNEHQLNQVFDQLFRDVAAGRGSGQAGATTGQGELGSDDVYQRVRRENIDVKAQRALMRMLQSEDLSDRVAAGTILDWVDEFRIQGIFQPDQKVPALAARSRGIGWWQLLEGKRARMICHRSSTVPILIFKKDLDQDSLISVFRMLVSRNRFSRCVDRGRICTVPRCRALFAID